MLSFIYQSLQLEGLLTHKVGLNGSTVSDGEKRKKKSLKKVS